MWLGEMKNTYWWKCSGRINQGYVREDDRKQDGKMRANETWTSTGLKACEEMDSAKWSIGRSSVIPATPIWMEKQGGKRKKNSLNGKVLVLLVDSEFHDKGSSILYNILTYRYDCSIWCILPGHQGDPLNVYGIVILIGFLSSQAHHLLHNLTRRFGECKKKHIVLMLFIGCSSQAWTSAIGIVISSATLCRCKAPINSI